MTKRAFNPLMAYIEACQGRPEWLIDLLCDAGFDDLAEGIKGGEVKFKALSEHDWDLLCAAIEFRERGKPGAIDEIAIKHGVGVDELQLFVGGTGGVYVRLRDNLPKHLFPDMGKGRKVPRP
jgi:hypothetical protein